MLSAKDYWEHFFKAQASRGDDSLENRPAALLPTLCPKYIEKGSRVLDVGCGDGRNAQYLAQHGYQVFGIDFALSAIKLCQRRFAHRNLFGTFVHGTFDRIPYPNNHFAAVICIAGLDYVTYEGAQATLREIRRVLVPRGIIILAFDPPDQGKDILERTKALPDNTLKYIRGKTIGMLFRHYPDKEIKDLLGERSMIFFDSGESGIRTVVCRYLF